MKNLALVVNHAEIIDSYDVYLEKTFGSAKCHVSTFGFETTVSVTFSIDANEWKSIRKKGQLGSLYGVDLSNYLSRKCILRFYAVPSVDDHSRAKNGIKTIRVTYTKRDF